MRELWERARGCWNKILAHDSRSILVVAHNAVNQALVATAIGTFFCPKVNLNAEDTLLINTYPRYYELLIRFRD